MSSELPLWLQDTEKPTEQAFEEKAEVTEIFPQSSEVTSITEGEETPEIISTLVGGNPEDAPTTPTGEIEGEQTLAGVEGLTKEADKIEGEFITGIAEK